MSILALELSLLIVFTYLTNIGTVGQRDFFRFSCGKDAIYTRNSRYGRNLDTTLTTLVSTNSGFGFFNHSTGQGIDNAKSIALCRGDVETGSCSNCLNDAIVKLRKECPNQMEAVGYYSLCLLRYSNQTLLGDTDQSKDDWVVSSDTVRLHVTTLQSLLDNLTHEAAAGGSLMKFAIRNMSEVYGLAQCTPDLSNQECTKCLKYGIKEYMKRYGASVGGRYLAPMCNFRYEIYPFYSTSPITPPGW